MLTLNDREAVAAALNDPDLNPCLRTLLAIRAAELFAGDREARLFVVQGGDRPDVINGTVGFAMTGEAPEDPGYEWIEGHGRWFEVALTTAAVIPVRVFVENGPATELGIHAFCLAHFGCEGGEE